MSRVFWDAMLFIYLLESDDARADRVTYLLERSRERGDTLLTSHLAVGEVLAGARKFGGAEYVDGIQQTLHEMGFTRLPFDAGAVETFSRLRSVHRVKTADAIHLACAAAARTDLFLTGDGALTKLYVPGIHFIAEFDTPLL